MANGRILGICVPGPLLSPSPLLDASVGGLQGSPSLPPRHPPGSALTSICKASWGLFSICPRDSARSSTSQVRCPIPLIRLQLRLGTQQPPWGWDSGGWGLVLAWPLPLSGPPPPLKAKGHCSAAVPSRLFLPHSQNIPQIHPLPRSPLEGPFSSRYQILPLRGLSLPQQPPLLPPSPPAHTDPTTGLVSVLGRLSSPAESALPCPPPRGPSLTLPGWLRPIPPCPLKCSSAPEAAFFDHPSEVLLLLLCSLPSALRWRQCPLLVLCVLCCQ